MAVGARPRGICKVSRGFHPWLLTAAALRLGIGVIGQLFASSSRTVRPGLNNRREIGVGDASHTVVCARSLKRARQHFCLQPGREG